MSNWFDGTTHKTVKKRSRSGTLSRLRSAWLQVKTGSSYTDTGNKVTGLTVNGTATGLTFGLRYVSLFYANGSVPSGPTACEPTNKSLTIPQMVIGSWTVKADGTGSLHAVKTGSSYVPHDKVHTQAIRHVISLKPRVAPIVACGEVHDVA